MEMAEKKELDMATQIELLRNTVAKGATSNELALLMYRAKQMGLDPLTGQIHLVKRVSFDMATQQYQTTHTIQVGIDGFRLIAERSGLYDGQDPIKYVVERVVEGAEKVVETQYVLPDDKPLAAIAAIYKKGINRPFVSVAHYKDYVQTKKDGTPTIMWLKWPIMLGKCAEAAAFRKGFPELNITGIYEPSEIPAEDAIITIPTPIEESRQPLVAETQTQQAPEPEEVKAATATANTAKGTPPTDTQIKAIRRLAATNGVSDDLIGVVLGGLDFESAGNVIKQLNKKDLSVFLKAA